MCPGLFLFKETASVEEPGKKASILTELVALPKTVRDRVKNQAVLEEMNRGHEDDIFLSGGGPDDFSFNLLGSSHDSEESDIRLVKCHFLCMITMAYTGV